MLVDYQSSKNIGEEEKCQTQLEHSAQLSPTQEQEREPEQVTPAPEPELMQELVLELEPGERELMELLLKGQKETLVLMVLDLSKALKVEMREKGILLKKVDSMTLLPTPTEEKSIPKPEAPLPNSKRPTRKRLRG